MSLIQFRDAGVYPSCHLVRGRVQPGRRDKRDKQPSIFTPRANLGSTHQLTKHACVYCGRKSFPLPSKITLLDILEPLYFCFPFTNGNSENSDSGRFSFYQQVSISLFVIYPVAFRFLIFNTIVFFPWQQYQF